LTSGNKEITVEHAIALTLRGNVARSQNQLRQAITFYTTALPLHTAYGYQAEIARTELGLGRCYLQLQELETAYRHLTQAQTLFKKLNDPEELAHVTTLLTQI